MPATPTARHLLRARDLADREYAQPMTVDDMAAAAGFSRAHFTSEFRAAFGETPRAYLLTRRLERAAALLLETDMAVHEICLAVGLTSHGSFTSSFTRVMGMSPTAYRWTHRTPGSSTSPTIAAGVPGCVVRAHARPANRTFREA